MRKIKVDASHNQSETVQRANPHRGSGFDEFLSDEGIFEETHEKASERARNEQIEDGLQMNAWATSCPPYPPSLSRDKC
jgi:hypothetical protein